MSKPLKNVGKSSCINTQQSNVFREIVAKELLTSKSLNKLQLDKLKPYFQSDKLEKNHYLAMMKKTGLPDHSFRVSYKHPLMMVGGNDQQQFCKKCKRDHAYCPHQQTDKNDLLKDKNLLKAPITSTQEYGWRNAFDVPEKGNGIKHLLN